MKKLAFVALALSIAFLQACQRHHQRGPGQEVVGMVLNPGVRLQTAQNMIINAGDRAGGKYSFVFGPYLNERKTSFDDPDVLASGGISPSIVSTKKPKSGALAPGRPAGVATALAPAPATTMAVFSTTGAATQPSGHPVSEDEVEVFEVQSGMALFWGMRPKVKTKRKYIGTDGTKFLEYVEPGNFPTVEHTVLVDPVNSESIRIYKLDEQGNPYGDPVILSMGHLYARLNPDGTFTLSDTVPPDIQAVVDYAKAQAAAAGVWP